MAKVKLGNVKGPKGEQGVRGSKWYNTDKITGESTSGTAFPNSGIADAMVGDMALNPTTLNLYTCQTAGNAATAKWVFMACIKGPQGAKGDKGDPTTVDAALSKDSANPIQNKAVATKIQDVEDSLGKVDKRLRSGGNEPIRLDWREVAGGPKLCVYVSETEVVRFTPTFPK